jgi:hypothetical protein
MARQTTKAGGPVRQPHAIVDFTPPVKDYELGYMIILKCVRGNTDKTQQYFAILCRFSEVVKVLWFILKTDQHKGNTFDPVLSLCAHFISKNIPHCSALHVRLGRKNCSTMPAVLMKEL